MGKNLIKMKVTIGDIRKKFHDLINEVESREEIAKFAARAIEADDRESLEIDHEFEQKIWESIIYLSGVDLMDSPYTYLHSTDNFIEAMIEIGL